MARGAACGERDGAPQALVGRRLDKGEHCLGLDVRVQFEAVAAAAAMAAAVAVAATMNPKCLTGFIINTSELVARSLWGIRTAFLSLTRFRGL